MKIYTQDNLGKCRVCTNTATVIISKTMRDHSVLFSYCSFHAELAEQFFGFSETRVEIKGGFRLA